MNSLKYSVVWLASLLLVLTFQPVLAEDAVTAEMMAKLEALEKQTAELRQELDRLNANSASVDAAGNVVPADAVGNATLTDAAGNVVPTDAAGNVVPMDAAGNVVPMDAAGNSAGAGSSVSAVGTVSAPVLAPEPASASASVPASIPTSASTQSPASAPASSPASVLASGAAPATTVASAASSGVETLATATETGVSPEVSALVEQKVQEQAWKKGDSWIRPYGMFWVSMLGANSRFTPNDAVQRILLNEHESVCTLTARRSRFGLDVKSVDLPCAPAGSPLKLDGRVEIDFMSGIAPAENKSGVMLRHAYVKVANDYGCFLFGQTNDVISPLNSHTLNYYNMWSAGNIGYRNPQMRLSHYFYPSRGVKMEATVALCQICGADFSSNDRTGGWPTIQSRLGWTFQRCCPNLEAIQFGISGHVGEQKYAFGSDQHKIDTWSANVDLRVPLTARMGFQGEFFHGQGLAAFCGGIGQSLDYSLSTGAGSGRSIHSTGGWAELWYDLNCKARLTVGGGVDDPLDSDMTAATILKNAAVYTNVVYNFTSYLRTGLEYSYWWTDYATANNTVTSEQASVIEWMWQFEF